MQCCRTAAPRSCLHIDPSRPDTLQGQTCSAVVPPRPAAAYRPLAPRHTAGSDMQCCRTAAPRSCLHIDPSRPDTLQGQTCSAVVPPRPAAAYRPLAPRHTAGSDMQCCRTAAPRSCISTPRAPTHCRVRHAVLSYRRAPQLPAYRPRHTRAPTHCRVRHAVLFSVQRIDDGGRYRRPQCGGELPHSRSWNRDLDILEGKSK